MSNTTTLIRFVGATLALALWAPLTAATPRETENPEAAEALARHGAAFARHMVRVRIQRSVEIRRVDGLFLQKEILPEGITTGLVLTREPLILVTASDVLNQPKNLNPRLSSRPTKVSERQFVLILKDGSTIETEIVGRIESFNMITLRPRGLEQVPDELQHPLTLEQTRRPVAGEMLGLVTFTRPLRSSHASTFTFNFPADRPDYARPVMTMAGLGHLNCPVLAVDGSLTGILNLSPTDTTSELRPEDLEAGAAKDPLASVAARKYAFLITGEELPILLGDLIRQSEPVVPYTLFGFRLQVQGGVVRVHSLIEPGTGDPGDPDGLRPGDIVLALEGIPVTHLEEFDQVLEKSLEQGASRLSIELERNGTGLEVVLTP